MILEITRVDVLPGMEDEFERRVARALPIFQGCSGWRGMELQRAIEPPNRFHLVVRWDTVERHAVDFACSPAFEEWRKLVGHLFLGSPEVAYFQHSFSGY
ncbi:MAG: antibiotic biosynthesis monooxygenase [Paraburkholderia sp.]|jgi:heme-degrading monooxygenase HmoA|nr:antibiotic biosynthesis monooxygenase [Paraburkholderia sp.]